ncbi:response regulator [Antarcticirhabdus aurantiaca]|uniref:Response regulator n=1 Tax=Antarcticirhabdus aurantiaca TaxID=2606717 RepID=A0ACD4NR78_9HYPH|nr:response regulator [Antarcticirhabdus aurantiaca]WAJ29440.1 response regulator [Jeongeuplla avenae]
MAAQHPSRQPRPMNLSGKRILIVEDDYFIAFDMACEFQDLGAVVLGPVPSMAQALALLAADDAVDGATLDINLPDGAVFPSAEELQRLGVPFVFSTSYEEQLIPAAFRHVPYHQKPQEAAWLARSLFGDG